MTRKMNKPDVIYCENEVIVICSPARRDCTDCNNRYDCDYYVVRNPRKRAVDGFGEALLSAEM